MLNYSWYLSSYITFSVEGIRGYRPQAPFGERAQAASVQNEDLFPGPDHRQVPLLVLPAATEEVQEDHRRNRLHQGMCSCLLYLYTVCNGSGC